MHHHFSVFLNKFGQGKSLSSSGQVNSILTAMNRRSDILHIIFHYTAFFKYQSTRLTVTLSSMSFVSSFHACHNNGK